MAQQFKGRMLEDGQVVRIPCEVWSRTVGYLRPVQNWHDGKKQEFKDRKTYSLGKSFAGCEETETPVAGGEDAA